MVAEHKNCYLLEVAETIMLHSNLPQHFQLEAILTTCFLINCVPLYDRENIIPWPILQLEALLFLVPPQIFGSTCFINLLGPRQGKLSPWVEKCIFLEYPCTQKGYRNYSPSGRKWFMSADVVFFEDIPFYFTQGSGLTDDIIYTSLPITWMLHPVSHLLIMTHILYCISM